MILNHPYNGGKNMRNNLHFLFIKFCVSNWNYKYFLFYRHIDQFTTMSMKNAKLERLLYDLENLIEWCDDMLPSCYYEDGEILHNKKKKKKGNGW